MTKKLMGQVTTTGRLLLNDIVLVFAYVSRMQMTLI
jgi:hypothetical protein